MEVLNLKPNKALKSTLPKTSRFHYISAHQIPPLVSLVLKEYSGQNLTL